MKITENTKGLNGSVDFVDTKELAKLKEDNKDLRKLCHEVLDAVHNGDMITGPGLEDWGQELYHIEHRGLS